jgi:oligopeptide/dipeptide ABC transporter ATP-binding protein
MEMNRVYKTSLVIISHDLSIIKNFTSRFLVMYSGKIVEEGTSQNLFSPSHPYTKALVGAIPSKEKRGQELSNIGGKLPSVEDNLSGCPFAPRCPKKQTICESVFPKEKESEKGKVYCHFPVTGENYG